MKVGIRVALLMAIVASLLALPAISLGDTVRIRATAERTWRPAFKQVVKGTKVVWKNPTGTRHTVTAYSSNWSKDVVIKPGERTAKTFKRTGAYYYRCRLHSALNGTECTGMCGHVHVSSS